MKKSRLQAAAASLWLAAPRPSGVAGSGRPPPPGISAASPESRSSSHRTSLLGRSRRVRCARGRPAASALARTSSPAWCLRRAPHHGEPAPRSRPPQSFRRMLLAR
eukprot:scaffold12817_cov75-Phaeocystis_antarctica.AAC.4